MSQEPPPGGADASRGRVETAPDLEELDIVDVGPPNDPLVGTILADRFRIVSKIGIGGMGAVYRAEHIHMRKPVAVKVLHREMMTHPEVVQRFEREAVAAGRIEHPNVAKATDFGRLDDGSFYLVLEYVEGIDLADLLNRGPVPLNKAIHIAQQVCEALTAAHAAEIVHRDLKPENVMLLDRPGEPEIVKVLDFGIAKVQMGESGSEQLTKIGTVFGTPQYMAPEQAAGRAVDHRADLYTVGTLLYEMLVGTVPFDDDDMVRVLSMQIDDTPAPLPGWVDSELSELTMQLLAKDPDARPQPAERVAMTLAAILDRLGGPPLPDAPDEARQMLESYTERVMEDEQAVLARATASRSLHVGKVNVPVWALVLGGLSLIAVAATATTFAVLTVQKQAQPTSTTSPPGPEADGVEPAPPANVMVDPKDEAMAARAATGDEDAIATLEALPEDKRSAGMWLALGRGYMKTKKKVQAIAAYDRAIDLDAALAKDQSLLIHVREAARSKDGASDAVALAAKRLGPAGADILYDVWVATRAKTPTTQLAKELVYSAELRKQASPALNIVLDLRDSETCQDIKDLLPRTTLKGDARSLRVLMPLLDKTGCGERKKGDCWECLREDSSLEDAVAAVRARQVPPYVLR